MILAGVRYIPVPLAGSIGAKGGLLIMDTFLVGEGFIEHAYLGIVNRSRFMLLISAVIARMKFIKIVPPVLSWASLVPVVNRMVLFVLCVSFRVKADSSIRAFRW